MTAVALPTMTDVERMTVVARRPATVTLTDSAHARVMVTARLVVAVTDRDTDGVRAYKRTAAAAAVWATESVVVRPVVAARLMVVMAAMDAVTARWGAYRRTGVAPNATEAVAARARVAASTAATATVTDEDADRV